MTRALTACSLAVWGAVLLGFVLTGRVASYLHPGFHLWTALSGGALLLIACVVLWDRGAHGEPCGGCCGHEHGKRRVPMAQTLVLVAPLLLATVLSPSEFGPTAIMNRGLAESIVDVPGYEPGFESFREPALPTEDGSPGPEGDVVAFAIPRGPSGGIEVSPVDLLYAANLPEMRRSIQNERIEAVGQFFPARTNNPDGDRFALIRLYILCCAADARPVAVTVRAPPGTEFPKMTWIRAIGTVRFPTEAGETRPLIEAERVEITPPPEQPLLY